MYLYFQTCACISLLSCTFVNTCKYICSVWGLEVGGLGGLVGGIEELETGEHNINIFD